MTAQPRNFDRLVAELLDADGPQSVPEGFLDRSINAAQAVPQRRPLLDALDARAWPAKRPLGLSPRALRLVALAALLGLAVVAAVVGASLLQQPSHAPGSLIVWVPDSTGGGVLRTVVDDGTVVRAVDLPPVRHCPRLLPDGQRVAYWQASDPGSLVLQPLDGTPTTVVADTTFRDPGTEAWSPDGWRVALRSQTLRIVNAADGTVLRPTGQDGVRAVAWSPTGELTVARQLTGELEVVALDLVTSSARPLLRYPWDSGADGNPFFSWSPDGRYLLYTTHQYADVLVFDKETGQSTTILTAGAGLFDTANAWAADGRLALVDGAGQIVIARPDGSRIATVPVEAAAVPTSLGTRWAPDGSSLAVTDFDGVVVTMDPDGSHQEAHELHDIDTIAWSGDSSWLAVQIRGANDEHQAEVQLELYSAMGLPARALGPFTATDGFSGGTFPCLDWSTN